MRQQGVFFEKALSIVKNGWGFFCSKRVGRSLYAIVKGLLAYIAIAGIVTLSLFMLEEAFQTAMFGTWPAQDANRWDVVYDGCIVMEATARSLRAINRTCGWIQPLAYIAYDAYADAADSYIRSLRAKIFAHEPELFVGQQVEVSMTPTRFYKIRGDWVATNGRISLVVRKPVKTQIRASGELVRKNNTLWILQ